MRGGEWRGCEGCDIGGTGCDRGCGTGSGCAQMPLSSPSKEESREHTSPKARSIRPTASTRVVLTLHSSCRCFNSTVMGWFSTVAARGGSLSQRCKPSQRSQDSLEHLDSLLRRACQGGRGGTGRRAGRRSGRRSGRRGGEELEARELQDEGDEDTAEHEGRGAGSSDSDASDAEDELSELSTDEISTRLFL